MPSKLRTMALTLTLRLENMVQRVTVFTIGIGGNAGIGTTSPDSPLELEVATAGSTQTRLAHFDHNPTGNTGSGFIRLSIWE